ncbi:MAG: GIY-YIG nuclease family protein [Dehalococcoidales bacterium]|nr:GIY-YIG nuclease family protein [Dehalococcoidales bacterium]
MAGKGSYILLISLPGEQAISVGSLKTVCFPRGYYAYVGSALGGYKARLNRHLRADKRPRWHIDYLLREASINEMALCPTTDRVECAMARALSQQFDSIPGFGCSDCRCCSHLFFTADNEELKAEVISIIKRLGIKPVVI